MNQVLLKKYSQTSAVNFSGFLKLFFCLFSFVLFLPQLFASESDWTFEDAYRDRLAFLHAFLNYDFNAIWHSDWEKNYFSGNGFLLAVGSVTTHDLLVNGSLVINQS
jgi:hypothetical protein